MDTLLLDQTTNDLVVDAFGNIAVASAPYSQAQDAASNIKTFSGEVFYDTTIGVQYFSQILGKPPNVPLLKTTWANAVTQGNAAVPGVAGAQCFITAIEGRDVSAQVQITDSQGNVLSAANFIAALPPGGGV